MRHRPGRRLAVNLKGPAVGVDPHHHHIAQAIGIVTFDAHLVINGLSVRPAFHLPGGDRTAHAHARPHPFDPRARVCRAKCAGHNPVKVAPRKDQFGAFEAVEVARFKTAQTAALTQRRHGLGRVSAEFLRVRERPVGGHVPDVQMAQDGVDRPAFEAGLSVQARGIETLDQSVDRFAFVQKILGLDHHTAAGLKCA